MGYRLFIFTLLIWISCAITTAAFELESPECIAPAKPGGGHDNMCRLLALSFAQAGLGKMTIRYMPGGIGALAYNHAVSVGNRGSGLIVAASTGSALNLALGKFGVYTEKDVRWLGALATDYGVIAVRGDAPWTDLDQLITTLRTPGDTSLVFGAGGSVGSQDWTKAALLYDRAGLDPETIRYIPYEGGGEASNALLRGYTRIFSGDLSEVARYLETGKIRILAVLTDKRLPGKFSKIPTALEQGYDVVWPVWRGYYLPPGISNDEYQWWVNTLYRLENTKIFREERERLQLFPKTVIGEPFQRFVRKNVEELKATAKRLGLVR